MIMAQKILVVGPSWVGDTMMAQCLFQLLQRVQKGAVIDVLSPAWTFALLSRMPEVNVAIEMPITHGELKLRERYQLAKSLQSKQYDQAIVLPNTFKSALIPWLARIPKRTGWVGEWRYPLLNDIRKLDKTTYPRLVDQYMALGLPKGSPLPSDDFSPVLMVSQSAQQATLSKQQLVLPKKPILALCAGAAFGSAKRWPASYYAEVANEKIKQGWEVWLFGSANDRAVTDEIMSLTHHQCQNVAGKLELNETIDLLSLVSGVITNDSGLLHVASALNKPIIAIYGPTSPDYTPPLSKEAMVLQETLPCQPCFQRECPLTHHQCMKAIMPDQVLSHMHAWGI